MIIEVGISVAVAAGLFVFGVLFGRANPKKTQAAVDEFNKIVNGIKQEIADIKAKLK